MPFSGDSSLKFINKLSLLSTVPSISQTSPQQNRLSFLDDKINGKRYALRFIGSYLKGAGYMSRDKECKPFVIKQLRSTVFSLKNSSQK